MAIWQGYGAEAEIKRITDAINPRDERIAVLEKQLAEARETNRRLNRRTQEAEAAVPSYQRLIAIPPDGDGVRLAGGNMGRSLLTWYCTQQVERADAAEQQVAALTAELEAVRRDAETEAEVIARVEETANLIPELAIGNYGQGYRAAMSRIKTILASRTAQGGRHAGT